jgi:redox-regulated HSP33 family molecular chaperone
MPPFARSLEHQELIREVNRNMAADALKLKNDTPVEFVCECSDPKCRETVPLRTVALTQTPESGPILAPGHTP